VLVYADREHFANLTWLVNYDPHFEEGLLVLGRNGQRTLIVGNEGLGHLQSCECRWMWNCARLSA
jgi:hypothetical protein